MSEIEPVVAAFKKSATSYSSGNSDFTATSLIRSPRQVQMKKMFSDCVQGLATIEDPKLLHEAMVKHIPSFEGTAVHDRFESLLKETPWNMGIKRSRDWLVEQRFFTDINGYRISGQIDVYSFVSKVLYDYKRQSTYVRSLLDNTKWLEKLKDYEVQLNVGAALMRLEGLEVLGVAAIPIYKDWMESKSKYDKMYPQQPIEQVDLPLWSQGEALDYLHDRVMYHAEWIGVAEVDLPDCEEHDLWLSPATWAVMKQGQKKALTLLKDKGSTLDAARDFILNSNDKDKLYLRETTANRRKCEGFCDYAPFCTSYKNWLEANPTPGSTAFYEGDQLNEVLYG